MIAPSLLHKLGAIVFIVHAVERISIECQEKKSLNAKDAEKTHKGRKEWDPFALLASSSLRPWRLKFFRTC